MENLRNEDNNYVLFFFCQQFCTILLIHSLLRNSTVGSWGYSQNSVSRTDIVAGFRGILRYTSPGRKNWIFWETDFFHWHTHTVYTLSLSLSLSLTHTHTNTHTYTDTLSLSLPLSLSLSRSGEHCSVTVTGSRTFSSLRVKSYSVLITENLINQQNWGVLSKPIEQPLDCLLEFC